MNKIIKAVHWIIRSLLFISIAVFIIFYLRWFRIAPFVFLDDPTRAFIAGMILLFIFIALTLMTTSSTVGAVPRIMFYVLTVPLLLANFGYLKVHMPEVKTVSECNGVTYYISYGAPLLDEQWTYVQLSKWKGLFYESYFLGYASGAGANEVICDVERKETHFVRTYYDPYTLTFIDGENPQGFDGYNSARLKNNLYFLAEDWSPKENCNLEETGNCNQFVFTLYECNLDYKDCDPLPIAYTTDDTNFILKANESTNEISLFQLYFHSDDETLIFSYGEDSRCYVDGCSITSK